MKATSRQVNFDGYNFIVAFSYDITPAMFNACNDMDYYGGVEVELTYVGILTDDGEEPFVTTDQVNELIFLDKNIQDIDSFDVALEEYLCNTLWKEFKDKE
jgi:hypothetical protein